MRRQVNKGELMKECAFHAQASAELPNAVSMRAVRIATMVFRDVIIVLA
jgi:hypothetical protein